MNKIQVIITPRNEYGTSFKSASILIFEDFEENPNINIYINNNLLAYDKYLFNMVLLYSSLMFLTSKHFFRWTNVDITTPGNSRPIEFNIKFYRDAKTNHNKKFHLEL